MRVSVFDDLAGQDRVVTELRLAAATQGTKITRGAVSGMTHAWLFTGPPGSGRSVAARAFAAALLCQPGGTPYHPGTPRTPTARNAPPSPGPDLGCGDCASCHQVLAGTHADLLLVRPDGLSYGVRQTRDLVLRAATAPVSGRWRVIIFEDADRATEQAANALLKAIEEPTARTVWLLCAPSPDDLAPTIRSRCRLVTLRTPPAKAIADMLARRDGIDPERALQAARAAQGHIGRARRLAARTEVLQVPASIDGLGSAIAAAARLIEAADAEAAAVTAALDEPEQAQLRRALGEGSTGKGVAKAVRGAAGALKELTERQKSRATRLKRDSLDRALLDLAGFYRDVLAVQFGAPVELANADVAADIRRVAAATTPEATLRRMQAIMTCRERLEANAHPLLAAEAMTLALLAG